MRRDLKWLWPVFWLCLLGACLAACQGASRSGPLKFRVRLDSELAREAAAGRLLVFMSEAPQPSESLAVGFLPDNTWMAAMEVAQIAPGQTIEFNPDLQAYPRPFSQAKRGTYQVMALLDTDHNFAYGGQNEGDLCSPVIKLRDVTPANGGEVALVLDRRTERDFKVADTENIRLVELQSQFLTAFWKRPITMRAGIVLPPSYHHSLHQTYAALYHIHGFGGDHTAAWQEGAALSRAMNEGKEAELIHVFLDGSFPTGHHLFADSVNNGPWARALVEEFIPHLEGRFRMSAWPEARFLTGHSSGGWSALWLQITHPDFFGGAWSTAPDPVDFRNFIGVDVTPGSSDNVYRARDGKPRNLARNGSQEILSIEEFARQEAVKGEQGGQLASFEWVWSPKGADGRPLRLFDCATGELNPVVQQAWQQYDIRLVLEKNWARLGPKLEAKINVVVGSEDTFHLDRAVTPLCDLFRRKGIAAVCEIVPGRDHDNLYQPFQTCPDGLTARINKEIQAKLAAHQTRTKKFELVEPIRRQFSPSRMTDWKMDPDKSKHDGAEPFPQSFVMRIEPHPEGEAITVWRVTQDGRSETDSYIQRFDGKDYPYPREERLDSFNARKLEDGAIEITFKKDGKVVVRQTRRQTADGQQMTIEYQFLAKTGQWLDRVVVLEKQKE